MGRCPFSLCSELSSPKNEDKLSEKGFRALNQMMYLVFSGYLFVAQLMCMRKTCAVVQMKNTVRLYHRQKRKNLCNPLLWCNGGSNTAGLLSALSMPFFGRLSRLGLQFNGPQTAGEPLPLGPTGLRIQHRMYYCKMS